MRALVLQVVVASSSKICTLAAPRSVFWCPGSTVGTCECLCLPCLLWCSQSSTRKRQQIGMGELHTQATRGFRGQQHPFVGVFRSSSSTSKHFIANVWLRHISQDKPRLLSRCRPAQLLGGRTLQKLLRFHRYKWAKDVGFLWRHLTPSHPSSLRAGALPAPRRCPPSRSRSPQPHQEKHEGRYPPGERAKHPHLCRERMQ